MQTARYTFLFAFLIFTQTVSFGQSRQRWSFGPRVGLNLTNFVGNDVPTANPNFSQKLLPGISAGVGFVYSDVSRFGFGIDALYSQRGSHFQGINGVTSDNILRVDYLELPITGRYYLTRSGNFRPNVYLGAVPALRLNAKFDTDNSTSTNYVDVSQQYRSADLGLTGGVQLNWGTGDRQHFTIDLRYTQGVTNISAGSSDLRNQMITVGLGYYFGIGRQYRPGDRKLPIRAR